MKTLESAWNWYTDVRASLKRMRRIGERYWQHISWTDPPWRGDNHFIRLEKHDVTAPATNGLQHLDDLAVVVLFSVFESLARDRVLRDVTLAEAHFHHRAISRAIHAAKERIAEGSFFAVLDLYKGISDNLIEEVNQVRRYRNWVAHGRRGEQPPAVWPELAYQRLRACLLLFAAPPEFADEWIAVAAYHLWEQEGRSVGKQDDHWQQAIDELDRMWKSDARED